MYMSNLANEASVAELVKFQSAVAAELRAKQLKDVRHQEALDIPDLEHMRRWQEAEAEHAAATTERKLWAKAVEA